MITYSPARSPGASSSSSSSGSPLGSWGGPEGTVGVYSFTIRASVPRQADFWKKTGRMLPFPDARSPTRAGAHGARPRVGARGGWAVVRREPLHGPQDRHLGQRPRDRLGAGLCPRLGAADAPGEQRRPGGGYGGRRGPGGGGPARGRAGAGASRAGRARMGGRALGAGAVGAGHPLRRRAPAAAAR